MVARPNVSRQGFEHNRDADLDLWRAHRAGSVAVFDSLAQGDASSDSAIHAVVAFEPTNSLRAVIKLGPGLQNLPGTQVDVSSQTRQEDTPMEPTRSALRPRRCRSPRP